MLHYIQVQIGVPDLHRLPQIQVEAEGLSLCGTGITSSKHKRREQKFFADDLQLRTFSSAMKEYRYELARKQQQVNLRNRVKW